MKIFNPKAKCPKCGYKKVMAIRKKAEETYVLCRPIRSLPERIERVCERCRYTWDQKPLDSEKERDYILECVEEEDLPQSHHEYWCWNVAEHLAAGDMVTQANSPQHAVEKHLTNIYNSGASGRVFNVLDHKKNVYSFKMSATVTWKAVEVREGKKDV